MRSQRKSPTPEHLMTRSGSGWLWWGLLTASPPEPHDDGDGVWRTVAGGWRDSDRNGERLTKDRLSRALTKLAAYRGTSCNVDVGRLRNRSNQRREEARSGTGVRLVGED